MAWIELHEYVWNHPKTVMLSHLLGISKTYAVAHMAKLWTWCIRYAPDGRLHNNSVGIPSEILAESADYNGNAQNFVEALIKSGYVDQTDEGLVIHDWHQYAGKIEALKAYDRERKRRQKERSRHSIGIPQEIRGVPADSGINPNPNPIYINNQQEADCAAQKRQAKTQAQVEEYPKEFISFWTIYPKKADKGAALKAWKARIKAGAKSSAIITGAEKYAASVAEVDQKYIKNPATFLNSLAYENEYDAPRREADNGGYADWTGTGRDWEPADRFE